MKLYTKLSQIFFLKKNYAFKIFFIAIIGLVIPFFGLFLCFTFYKNIFFPISLFGVLALIAFFVMLAGFFVFIQKIIDPIKVSSKAISKYRDYRTIPNLPNHFIDEIGNLMHNIQVMIKLQEKLLVEKQDLLHLLTHEMKEFSAKPAQIAQDILDQNPDDLHANFAHQLIENSKNQAEFIAGVIVSLKDEEAISKKDFRIKNINFNVVLTSVKKNFETKAKSKQLTLKIEQAIVEAKLKISQELLLQVLDNLLDNAIKFSNPGDEVVIKIKRRNSKLEISVIDYGTGFDASKNIDMFSRFNKTGIVDEKDRMQSSSLYLCKEIVKMADGFLFAESEGLNKGASFMANLKIYK